MTKKLLALSLVAVMLSVTAFANGEAPVFTKAGGKITAVTEKATVGDDVILNATHTATLPEAWDGTVAESIDTDANGTYLISNGAELAYFAAVVAADNTVNAKLDADINLNSKSFNAYQIGGPTTASDPIYYKGVFDGQGHTIYNLLFGSTQKHQATGLFRYVNGGTVKNLNVVGAGATLSSSGYSSIKQHSFVCAQLNNGTLENIYVTGEVKNFYNSAKYGRVNWWGAVCGAAYNNSFIRNCHSDVNVDFSKQVQTDTASDYAEIDYNSSVITAIGGVVGRLAHDRGENKGTSVINCGNSGTIFAPRHRNVGGVVGSWADDVHSLKNCYNTGDITGYGNVGGILGSGKCGGTARNPFKLNAYNTGTITAVAENDIADVLAGNRPNSTSDRPLVAGIAADVSNSAKGYAVYNIGEVRTKTAANTFENALTAYVEAEEGAYYVEGENYVEITPETDLSAVTTRYDLVNVPDDGGRDAYDAEAEAQFPDWAALAFVTPYTSTLTTSAIFYDAAQEGKRTARNTKGSFTDGVALTLEQFKTQETVAALNESTYANFAMDIGINDGYPILQSQVEELVTDLDTYQIGAYNTYETVVVEEATEETEAVTETITTAHNYELGVALEKAGYVSLNVKPFGAEEVTIKAYKADGTTELDSVTVSEAGVITLATGEDANVVIKATTGRALIKLDLDGEQAGDAAVTALENGVIEATFATEQASATIAIALYGEGNVLKKVVYVSDEATDGKISALIDLTDEDVSGCMLKAFLWAEDSPKPLTAEAVL